MIKRFKKNFIRILLVALSVFLTACGGEMPIGEVAVQIEGPETEATQATIGQVNETFIEDENPNEDIENKQLADIIGQDSLLNGYVMPGSQDMIIEELEPTYEGIERLQITYTVMKEYNDVLTFYQEATGRVEPDYYNAYGYFFDDVFIGEGEDYIEQILVQVLFGKSEVIMIIQNTSHSDASSPKAEAQSPALMDSFYDNLIIADEIPEFSMNPIVNTSETISDGIITVEASQSGLDLWTSTKHKGYSSVEAHYLIKAPFTEDSHKTVWLREDYIAEQVVVDEFNKKFTYFDPLSEIFYEANELADAEGGNPILFGTMLYLPAVNLPFPVSYNPLVSGPGVMIETCFLSELNGIPVIYVVKMNPTSQNQMWVKQWISLDYGIVIREEIYSDNTDLTQWSQLEYISFEEIPFDVFFPRQDVVYQDKTLSLYFRDNPYGSEFGQGFQSTFQSGYFDIDLVDEASGNGYTLTFNGDQMETMAEYELTEDMNGNPIEVIRFRNGDAFQVIIPSKEIVYLYPSSVYEHQWFQFDTLGFRKRTESGDGIVYTFEKVDFGNASGMIQRYDYHLDPSTYKFNSITTYLYDPNMGSGEQIYNPVTYSVKNPVASDDSIFKISDTYDTIWNFAHDDGEHAPPWY